MALFDLFKRQPIPLADLREALIDAVAREDWQGLAALCETHQDQIRAAFLAWRKVPEEVRSDPDAQGRYARGLIAVAQMFEQGGDRSLIAALTGEAADNPISAWERALTTAQSLLEQAQSEEAADLLQSTLRRTEGLTGDAVAHYLPRTYGMLGVARFRAGDAAAGIEATRRAKALCEQAGDKEGVAIYTGNLGRMETGAGILFRDAGGTVVAPSELAGRTGPFRYEVSGGDPVPPEAQALHERARQAGGRGEYDETIALLTRAAELAPKWPYPVYDMAYTYLLLNQPARAIEHYRKTLTLSPRGFFSAMTALHTLEREERGELPSGLYRAYLSLENIDDRPRRAEAARGLVQVSPGFAPAWKALALATDAGPERLAAIRGGLAASPDPETKGMLQLNLALALDAEGDHEAAVRLLEELSSDSTSTQATEHLAKSTLAALARA